MSGREDSWLFPTTEQIKKVCQIGQGEATCRYLAVGREGMGCEKGTSAGEIIDKQVEKDSMVAQGDNCEGILGFLCDGRLVGKRVHHKETGPTYEVEGLLKELQIEDGLLHLRADWEDGNDFVPSIATGNFNIDIRYYRIVISATFPGDNTWTFHG